ncbi:hypothetical protein ACP4OV_016407 [Aristida adscensionis]
MMAREDARTRERDKRRLLAVAQQGSRSAAAVTELLRRDDGAQAQVGGGEAKSEADRPEDGILIQMVNKPGPTKWPTIAKAFTGRSGEPCNQRWREVLNPELVKGPWSEKEDLILIEMVNRLGPKKWSTIAQAALPGRTGYEWQYALKSELVKGPWSKEEDEIIIQMVNKLGPTKWSIIANALPGRTGRMCSRRWRDVSNPELVKGPWSEQEDAILIQMVNRLGPKKWSTIAQALPGRTRRRCRRRWRDVLNPELVKGPWSEERWRKVLNPEMVKGPLSDEEDDTIIQMVNNPGPKKWSTIAQALPGRPGDKCHERYRMDKNCNISEDIA